MGGSVRAFSRPSGHRRAVGTVVAAGCVLALSSVGVARAADGDLDTTFDGGGRVTTAFSGGGHALALASQFDGKIVLVGEAAGKFALARYDSGGALDDGFGTGGIVTTAISSGYDEARGVAVQPDGKIVVTGPAGVHRPDFALARYDSGGALDDTFGTGGIVTTNIGPGYDIANGVVIQPDGKIIVVGSSGTYHPAFAIARYEPDGSLDPSFGMDGVVVTRFGVWGAARAVALQSNGRPVLVGTNGAGFAIARYLPDGELDPSFGRDGKVGDSFPLGDARAVALQSDGKIVVAGDRDIFRFAIARYTARGRLDATFGGDGRVTTNAASGGEQAISGIVVQPNRKIVGAGSVGPHEYGDPVVPRFVIVRYRANGRLDRTFGADGRVETVFDGGASASGATMQADGKILVVGWAGRSDTSCFALARYLVGS